MPEMDTATETLSHTHTLSVMQSTDWQRLGTLFQRVFGHPLSPELADYKYSQGRGASMGLLDSTGGVIAHCGMLYQRLRVAGHTTQGVQFGDLMVDPSYRGLHSKEGLPFNQVFVGALQYLKSKLGEHLVFGYPSKRATRLGEKLGLVTEIDTIEEVAWSTSTSKVFAQLQKKCGWVQRCTIKYLWWHMSRDFLDSILITRDSSYVERRYFNHPVFQYQVYVVREHWWMPPIGMFVLRAIDSSAELVDWVATLKNANAVVEQARRAAGALGYERLTTWQSKGFSNRLSLGELDRKPLPIVAAVGGKISLDWIRAFKGRIWVMPGDTDYH